ncbi:rod shape-determining protein MreC [Hyphobacterium sp. HN65]|uniref:Cell shape-determining protein MreC n=1 Tax=Hyphobacterium lacteum TaxID=3116575 RepID=A0ABU7LQS0_9PROT|nr:rod shape-determining protein MreC [Hyphobacterium sp. HN65]MEE2526268.1 rod shape-determining protein MreC [Hyphobacterium sp. HN65]
MAIGGSSRRNDDDVRFSRTFTVALFLLSIILIAFDRPQSRPPLLSGIRTTITDLSAPLLDLAAAPVRAVGNIEPYWRNQGRLAEENAELRRRLDETRYWRDLALQLRDQREVYEQALNVESQAMEERIGAWTLGDSDGPFVQSRLIGAGARSGVEDGDPVLNVYGMIGRVVETGQVSSRVLMLTDLNSRIPVMADRSNARAVLVGDNTAYPRLEFLTRDADLQDGDRIVTSGDDGRMPRGLPVGLAQRDRQGRWRVRLFSDQAPIDFVWVFPFTPIPPPVTETEAVEDTQPDGDEEQTAEAGQ